ncbi:MAG: hypothetical protein JO257_11635 [Deltaproteobacteria bacterium]|nr:hypothetical protein [Deltaproteobacteria bacterium]
MGGDNQKRPRSTKRFTREELAELADKARGEAPAPPLPQAQGDDEPAVTPMSRSQTLHDPMTTQLLAEVARRLQTMELEVPEGIVEEEESGSHPNVLRRQQKP